MEVCSICDKENELIPNPYLIVTGTQTQTKQKVGLRSTLTTTRFSAVEKHFYRVCKSCDRKYRLFLPAVVWISCLIIFILIAVFNKIGDTQLVMFLSGLILFSAAYFINILLISLTTKLKFKAIKERENAKNKDTLMAYTAREYNKYVQQSKKNK
ncbi:MAG: hypothetical protein MUO40_07040 [Anaerolineaceae bacterium]|nr:hypothetical protein [Anaerolineaceae bacterium]